MSSTIHHKPYKKQQDRLLKHLPLKDRRRQEQIRRLIAADPNFYIT